MNPPKTVGFSVSNGCRRRKRRTASHSSARWVLAAILEALHGQIIERGHSFPGLFPGLSGLSRLPVVFGRPVARAEVLPRGRGLGEVSAALPGLGRTVQFTAENPGAGGRVPIVQLLVEPGRLKPPGLPGIHCSRPWPVACLEVEGGGFTQGACRFHHPARVSPLFGDAILFGGEHVLLPLFVHLCCLGGALEADIFLGRGRILALFAEPPGQLLGTGDDPHQEDLDRRVTFLTDDVIGPISSTGSVIQLHRLFRLAQLLIGFRGLEPALLCCLAQPLLCRRFGCPLERMRGLGQRRRSQPDIEVGSLFPAIDLFVGLRGRLLVPQRERKPGRILVPSRFAVERAGQLQLTCALELRRRLRLIAGPFEQPGGVAGIAELLAVDLGRPAQDLRSSV